MKFTIREIINGVAVVDFDDGAWAEVPMNATDTEAAFIRHVSSFATKTYQAPSWAVPEASKDSAKVERTVTVPDNGEIYPVLPDDAAQWLTKRIEAYGAVASQIEFITEQGLAAWQEEVAAIKLANPIV
tara:strand:- start:499 stop:885 length:387 start_codon:yes stop_codon:yes gene_type:complete